MTNRETYGIIGSTGEKKRSSWNALTDEDIIGLIGERFGRLVVRSVVEYDKAYSIYLCACDCGATFITNRQRLIRGNVKSCGCLRRDVSSQPKPERRSAPGAVGFRKLYNRYKRSAEKRGYVFELKEDEFGTLTKEYCYYCDAEPSQQEHDTYGHSSYTYNGIDRKDNTEGYTTRNCVACCKECNTAKGKRSADEYTEHCRRVVRNVGRT